MRRRRREEGQSLREKISDASLTENKEGITVLSRVVFGVLRANLLAGGNSFAPIRWPEVVQRGPFVGGQIGACRKGGEDISDASFVQKKKQGLLFGLNICRSVQTPAAGSARWVGRCRYPEARPSSSESGALVHEFSRASKRAFGAYPVCVLRPFFLTFCNSSSSS